MNKEICGNWPRDVSNSGGCACCQADTLFWRQVSHGFVHEVHTSQHMASSVMTKEDIDFRDGRKTHHFTLTEAD